jgi:ribosomal protein L11 methylase PrmA
MADNLEVHPSSFRDPSGQIFITADGLFRRINQCYKKHYDHLMSSGLYKCLVDKHLLIPHEEINTNIGDGENLYKIIQPEHVYFISYPYEWCFSQIKDAALTTLEIQKTAMQYGMTLKDASAYNIQFHQGKPVLIDTLSFHIYEEGQYWVPYRQFCQHFLAPLALISYTDVRLSQLLRVYIDGIPLDLASNLLPSKTKVNLSLLSHIFLHAKSQKEFTRRERKIQKPKLSRVGLDGLTANIENTVKKIKYTPKGTTWVDYYQNNNYPDQALDNKKHIITDFIEMIKPESCWDLGGNTGLFSRLVSERGIPTVSFDIDPGAVEINYLTCNKEMSKNLLPLILDITNPSSGIGWENKERESLKDRGPVDLFLVLALVHHLVIGSNIPMIYLVDFFSNHCKWLIVEYVPKNDSQVQKMLSNREDVFSNFSKEYFENAFRQKFNLIDCRNIYASGRILYLYESI